MIFLLRCATWLGYTLLMSFVFLVLLDYGPERFPYGITKETQRLQRAVIKILKKVQ